MRVAAIDRTNSSPLWEMPKNWWVNSLTRDRDLMPLFRSTGSSQREIFDQNFPSFSLNSKRPRSIKWLLSSVLNKYEKISVKIVVNFMKVIKHFYFGFLKIKCMLKFTCILVIRRFLLTSKYGSFEEKGI